jgi:hypothetical protein
MFPVSLDIEEIGFGFEISIAANEGQVQ